MKLWIIYKEGIGFSKFIAEMLQDRLEDYIDVSVGNAKKIEPAFLVEEEVDFLIIGDIIHDKIPSVEIKNWLFKYGEISKNKNFNVRAFSGYYVVLTNISVEPFWSDFLQENVKAETIYPPILHLKLNLSELSLENRAIELVKDYSNDFIEFIINNKKRRFKKK